MNSYSIRMNILQLMMISVFAIIPNAKCNQIMTMTYFGQQKYFFYEKSIHTMTELKSSAAPIDYDLVLCENNSQVDKKIFWQRHSTACNFVHSSESSLNKI